MHNCCGDGLGEEAKSLDLKFTEALTTQQNSPNRPGLAFGSGAPVFKQAALV